MTDAVKSETLETQPVAPTETVDATKQEKFNDETYDADRAKALIEKLRNENKELSKSKKRADELEALEAKRKEAEMTELQKAEAKTAELEARLKAQELSLMRRDAAEKVGLPAVFVDRIRGETPEDMEADAKSLIEAMPKSPKTPAVNPTNPGNAGTGETMDQRRARIRGDNQNVFDPAVVRRLGGGAFVNMKEPPQ